MEKDILITGASGFIGKYISTYLYNKGYNILGVVRKKNIYDFPTIECDLSQKITIKGEFKTIIHIAGQVPAINKNIIDYKKGNIDVMENLLKFAENKGVEKFIYFSTIDIYGDNKCGEINENTKIVDPSPYGLTKYIGELLLNNSKIGKGRLSLRLPGVIGPETKNLWIINVIDKLKKNEDVGIYFSDFEITNFLDIDDLAIFTEHLLKLDCFSENIVNLACSKKISIKKCVNEIKIMLGSTSQIVENVCFDNRKPFWINNYRAQKMGFISKDPLNIFRKYLNLEIGE